MFKKFLSGLMDNLDPRPVQNISPDAMIVNGLMQSFASDYSDWTLEWVKTGTNWNTSLGYPERVENFPDISPRKKDWSSREQYYRLFKLENKKKKIIIELKYSYRSYYARNNGIAYGDMLYKATVNGVEIDGNAGRQLADAYLALKKKHDDAKAVADKALAQMKAEDAKWNIVEQVLDMKRTKSGRLIAKSSYCAVCDSPDPEKETEKLHNLSCPNRPAPKPRRPKVVKDPFVE